jgi:hypothetical protein
MEARTMTVTKSDVRAVGDPEGELEQALIQEFLRTRGLDVRKLHALPPAQAKLVLTEASVYAADRLAEVESRAHFVHEMHHQE